MTSSLYSLILDPTLRAYSIIIPSSCLMHRMQSLLQCSQHFGYIILRNDQRRLESQYIAAYAVLADDEPAVLHLLQHIVDHQSAALSVIGAKLGADHQAGAAHLGDDVRIAGGDIL
ncbi:hypothetical protein D3C76_1639440 [compost metagenome]